jgi:hypothetical protein
MSIIMPGPSQMTEIMLFRMIWLRSNKRSFLTGLFLRDYENSPLWANMFAHVLAKGQNKYPYFKYYARNIILLTPAEHGLLDQGTEEQQISYALDVEQASGGKNTAAWNKIKELETELITEYKLYFPSHKGLMIGIKYNIYEQQEIIGNLNKIYFSQLKK